MKFVEEASTIVIAGIWNNAIFNPEWVSKFLLNGENIKVEIPLNLNGSYRISTEELRIFTLDNRIHFLAIKNENQIFQKIATIALKVADYLPHTPVTAFGINFVFGTEINDKLNKCFLYDENTILEENNYKLENVQLKRSFRKDEYVLNLTIDKSDTKCNISFNYHFHIASLAKFKELMEEESVIRFKDNSLNLLKDLYELEL